jgi:uncharacterized protein with GYD domain
MTPKMVSSTRHVGRRTNTRVKRSRPRVYFGATQLAGRTPFERGPFVPKYLVQVSYSTEAWAALVKRPQNRVEVVRKVAEKLGGSVETFWLAFGDYDVVGIFDMPDNASAAAFAMAAAAGGSCKHVKTTPLLSIEEGLEAMKKAATSGYKPLTAKK